MTWNGANSHSIASSPMARMAEFPITKWFLGRQPREKACVTRYFYQYHLQQAKLLEAQETKEAQDSWYCYWRQVQRSWHYYYYLSARRRWGSLPLHPIWGSPPESFKVVIRCGLRNATRNLKFLLSWQKFGAQGQLSKQHSSLSSFPIPQRKKMLLYFSLRSTKCF